MPKPSSSDGKAKIVAARTKLPKLRRWRHSPAARCAHERGSILCARRISSAPKPADPASTSRQAGSTCSNASTRRSRFLRRWMAPTCRMIVFRCPAAADGSRRGWQFDTVMNDVNAPPLDAQQFFHLARGECRDRDDRLRLCRGLLCLRGEAPAEFGRGIISGEHEEIVESCHGMPESCPRQALIQAVEQIGAARHERLLE